MYMTSLMAVADTQNKLLKTWLEVCKPVRYKYHVLTENY